MKMTVEPDTVGLPSRRWRCLQGAKVCRAVPGGCEAARMCKRNGGLWAVTECIERSAFSKLRH